MATGANDAVLDEVKYEYMASIFEEIHADAQRRANGGEIKGLDAFRAFEDYFTALPRRRRGLGGFLQDNIFLLSAIMLTVTFVAFGLCHHDDQDVASFLAIAKIFAGAVVGGAAGSSVASPARRKEREQELSACPRVCLPSRSSGCGTRSRISRPSMRRRNLAYPRTSGRTGSVVTGTAFGPSP